MQTATDKTIPSSTFKNSLRTWQANYLARKAEDKPAEEADQVAALAAALQVKPNRSRRSRNRR
jgi:hypothetical protein